jgi:hypothetical protein
MPDLEPQTSPASSTITTEPQTETQGHVALNVPTPSFLKEITPQCTDSNARPRKHTTHGNISRTDELLQTQRFLAITVEGLFLILILILILTPNTTLPRHNGGRASTFTTNENPALTTLLTKGIQPIKNEPQLYKHIANTAATNYSYYLPL